MWSSSLAVQPDWLLDYEVELGVVIGKRARNVSRDEALEWARGKTILVLDQKDVPATERARQVAKHVGVFDQGAIVAGDARVTVA